MSPIDRLTEYFREFPGIGPRQARRFAYHLLTRNTSTLEDISRLIIDIKKNVRVCTSCFRFFSTQNNSLTNTPVNDVRNTSNTGAATLCPICSDPGRDHTQLMIVSRDADFESIEKSHAYQGLYFILGGTVPILEKSPETRIRSRELEARISSDANIKEIIISQSATSEGEHTADYIRSLIKNTTTADRPLAISVLGRGLSTGSELEYADADTIKNALTNRKA